MPRRFRCRVWASAVVWLVLAGWGLTVVPAQEARGPQRSGQTVSGERRTSTPPLSLKTLYHPSEQHDYDGEVASARWIATNPPQVIVRREKTWKAVDLQTGEEKDWPVVEQLARQLGRLQGTAERDLKAIAMRVAGQMQTPDDMSLVRIGDAMAIVSPARPARWLTRDASNWEIATLDPSRRRVAYTKDGDLYLQEIDGGRSLRLTKDGSETLLDGILDWTYQEEIFGRGNYRGFWFSHDGKWLAMLRIDISQIEPYVLTGADSDRGTRLVRRYSKAGDPIPHASLHVWDLRRADEGIVPPPRKLAESTPQQERIITGVWWSPYRNRLLYSISDRLQTWRELRYVDEPFSVGQEDTAGQLLREQSPAWVEPPSAPVMLRDGSLVWRSELPTGRIRLYWVRENGSVITPITPEDFDVRDFFVAPDGSFALVTGDADGGTVEQHAYRIELPLAGPGDGTAASGSSRAAASTQAGPLQRLTPDEGWNAIDFSPGGAAMIVTHSGPTSPPRVTVRPAVPVSGAGEGDSDERGTASLAFDPIELDRAELELPGGLIEPERFRIPTEDGPELPAMLIRPAGAFANRRVPVVIETYGGPGAPVVTARWAGKRALYRELLARQGIATLVVDNRSSAGRGVVDSWAIRHRVGEVEFQDLMEAVGWLQEQEWVDPERLAIRGWSFGGFMTLYAMTHSDAFAAGIAGGPVTDWREYDSFYTERYMGLPSQNEQGYRETAPLAKAADLHGRVLLIHGEVDDNVHPSNTLRMVAALQEAGKPFDLMIYPGAAHAVRDPQQAWHMAQLTDGFLREHLLRGGGD